MRPLVISELRDDLFSYNRCNYSITDNEFEFSIRRYNPEEYFHTLELV